MCSDSKWKGDIQYGQNQDFGPKGVWIDDPSQGQSAKIYDAQSKWVGEWVAADWGYSHGGRLGRYYFSPYDQNEQTEWMKPGSGDGFLVWDKNGNGIIDDNTEMMSEFDANGNKNSKMVLKNLRTTSIKTMMVLSKVLN